MSELTEAEKAALRQFQPGQPVPHTPGQDSEGRGGLIRRGLLTPSRHDVVLSPTGEAERAKLGQ